MLAPQDLSSNDTAPARSLRQFSILTLLLLTAVTGLSVTVGMLYRTIGPMRQELSRLRSEVGQLDISDPTRLHAISVDTDSRLEWKWRIWVPPGVKYRLRSSGGAVPAAGYPTDGGTIFLNEPGEHVIWYRIKRDPKRGGWAGSLHTRTGWVGGDNQPWVDWGTHVSTGGGVPNTTRAFDGSEKQIEIIRHRVSQKTKSSANIEDPAAGFMIWLEPHGP